MGDYSFKSSGVKSDDPRLVREVLSPPKGIKTPLELGTGRSGIFQMHFNDASQISDNLKNLILTNWGERLGNYYYGANLRSLTTEVTALEDFDAEAMMRIQSAVKNFMPYVELEGFNSTIDKSVSPTGNGTSVIGITVRYNIPQLRITGRAISAHLYCIG